MGSQRSGQDATGNPWSVTMKSHYGYIRGTKGKDKEHIDVFVRPGTPKDYDGPVYVINQEKPGKTREFDEHKVMIGFVNRSHAINGYYENYSDDWMGAGSVETFQNMEAFKYWLQHGDTTKPAGEDVIEGQAMFEPRSQYDANQLSMFNKPPTVWQGKEVEQTDMLGTPTTPEEDVQAAPEGQPRVRGVPGGRTLAVELTDTLNRDKVIDLRGAAVDTPEQMGELAQVYRNPHYETLRFFYLKDGKLIAHEGVTSRLPAAVLPFKIADKFFYKMRSRMERLGADGYYVLHNHPSGQPEPSRADMALTGNISRNVPGFKGHIVINNQEFSILPANEDGSYTAEKNNFYFHGIQNVAFRDAPRPLDHPLIGQSISDPSHVATMAKQIERAPGMVTLIYTINSGGQGNKVTAIQEVPTNFVESQDFGGYIRNAMNAFGAQSVFAALDAAAANRTATNKLRFLTDTNLFRDTLVLTDEQGQASVVSHALDMDERTFLEPGLARLRRNTEAGLSRDDVRSDRVREQQGLYEENPPRQPPPATKGPQRKLYDDPTNPNYVVSEPTALDNVVRKYVDQYTDIVAFVEAVQDAGYKIDDELNPNYKEEVYQQKVAMQEKAFIKEEIEPLVKKMKLGRVELADLDAYLHARHVINDGVNARLQAMNPDLEGNEALSGLTDEKAQEIIQRTPAHVKALAADVDAILAETRRLRVEYGLNSQETISAWEEAYKFYVPLVRRGFEDSPGTGRGRDVRGDDVRERLGSTRGVKPILASIMEARQRTIIRGEKMKPVVALAGLLTKYPNAEFASLAKAAPIMYTDAEGLIQSVPGDIGQYKVPMVKRKNKDGIVESVPDPNYTGRDNVVNFMLKGKHYAIVFNENSPRAVQAARALKDMDTENLNRAFRAIRPITQYLAAVNTQYNPVFGIVNLVRDTQFAMLTLSNTELHGKQGEVLANALANMRGIYAEARAQRRGEHSSTPASQLWRRFERAGGPTGYRDLFAAPDDRAKAIERMLSPTRFQQAWEGVGGQAVAGWLSDYNLMMENAIRLGVFQTAIENGVSDLKAASMAKNVTVNFNKKGNRTNQWGSLYAFFNAAAQGTVAVAKTLVRVRHGKVQGWTPHGKKIIQGGLLLGAMQTMVLAMAGFDEDDIPEWVLARNLVMPAPGTDKGYITIPMPLGFNAIPNVGRAVASTILYGNPGHYFGNMVMDMLDVFSPVGGVGSVWQAAMPSAADPFVALAENQDWAGRPIYRENMSGLDPTPGHMRSRGTASIWSEALSRTMNYISGGTDYRPGFASPSPDAIEYLIGQAGGGVLREVSKLARTIEATATGEELPTYRIPVAGRFVGTATGSAQVRSQYYATMERLNGLKRELEGRRENRGDVRGLLQDEPEARFAPHATRLHSRIKKLQQRRRELKEREGSSARVKLLDQRIQTIMERVINRSRQLRDAA